MLVTQRSAYGCRTPPQILLEEQLGLFSQRHLNLKGTHFSLAEPLFCNQSVDGRQHVDARLQPKPKEDLRTGCLFTDQQDASDTQITLILKRREKTQNQI